MSYLTTSPAKSYSFVIVTFSGFLSLDCWQLLGLVIEVAILAAETDYNQR